MTQPHTETAQRRDRAAAELVRRQLDALIVSAPPNVRYLTGFTGSNGVVLLWPGGAVLLTDPRYAIQGAHQADCKVRVARGSLYPVVMKATARRGFRKIGFESGRVSFQAYEELKNNLALGGSLEPLAGMVEWLRMVKSPAEVELIRRSVVLNSEAYARVLKRIKPGVSETDLAAEIEYQMRRLGAEKPAFETIVAFGPRTALPHAEPGPNKLSRNQLVLIDMGASREGYASDMTRVAFLGRPGRRVRQTHRAVLDAQFAALAAVRPGATAGSIDRAARAALRARKLDKAFVHSTGHGLGLEIHEPPRLGRREKTPLEPGMCITIEPGAYVEGFGGIRIEDTVVVTSSGCEILTPTSKELLEL